MEEEFSDESLKRSNEIIGALYDVLVAEDGEILDGKHRLAVNPNWPKKRVEAKSRVQKILFRMHAHHRRKVPKEETEELILELAKELEKRLPKELIANELARITPYTRGYVLQLLPPEYKQQEKVEAGKVGRAAQISGQKTPSQVPCSGPCGGNVLYPKYWEGKPVCSVCYDRLSRGEITLGPQKETPKPKVEEPSKPSRVEEKFYEPPGAFRERMQQPVSRMDEWVYTELQRRGVPTRFQEPVCIKIVIPDVTIDKGDKPLFVFLDHVDVHAKRSLVDMENRELLSRKGRVLQLTYDAFTEEQKQKIITDIISAVRGSG